MRSPSPQCIYWSVAIRLMYRLEWTWPIGSRLPPSIKRYWAASHVNSTRSFQSGASEPWAWSARTVNTTSTNIQFISISNHFSSFIKRLFHFLLQINCPCWFPFSPARAVTMCSTFSVILQPNALCKEFPNFNHHYELIVVFPELDFFLDHRKMKRQTDSFHPYFIRIK